MTKYKTVVTDYEGLQRCLDDATESGWHLFSVQPDTWRKVVGSNGDSDPLEAMGVPVGEPTAQYSASYYLIILYRDDNLEHQVGAIAQSEDLSLGDFSSGNY
jgi:hypothetical protein